ncbi:MAG TPA: hypothetical protein VHX17_12150 [Candidatus Cybelea sp.]|nr:hypothetical protein [Candidatus Cybelea sp.]
MPFLRCCLRTSLAALILLVPAACAQHGGALPAAVPAPTAVVPDAKPPKCKGQKTTDQYASLTETLSNQGGSLCVPAFGGFGGTVTYPPASPSAQLGLTTSTTNYDNMPNLGSGTPIFYIQLALQSATSFGSDAPAGGGLTAKEIKPHQPYTVYGQAKVLGFPVNFGPCFEKAKKGKYGGVLGGVGTLLEGVSIPAAANGVLEIYAGKQTATSCS